MNPYINYYNQQSGGGLPGFAGVRYQRGAGFFGRLFSGVGNFFKDLLPSVGKRVLPSAIGLAQDIISGQNVGQAAKKRLIEAGKNAADETLDSIKSKIQKGSGIIQRRNKRRKTYFNIHRLTVKSSKKKPMKKHTKKRSKKGR